MTPVVSNTDVTTDNIIPFATPFPASSFLFAPSIKLKYADAPSPNIKAKAANTIVIGKIIFVAPFPKFYKEIKKGNPI